MIGRRKSPRLYFVRVGIGVTVARLTLDQLVQVRILDPQLDFFWAVRSVSCYDPDLHSGKLCGEAANARQTPGPDCVGARVPPTRPNRRPIFFLLHCRRRQPVPIIDTPTTLSLRFGPTFTQMGWAR